MKHTTFFLFFVFAVSMPSLAMAYIGPGLGVVAVWALLGPIAAVISVLLLLSYFPARYYYKKHKNKGKEKDGEAEPDKDDDKSS